MKICARSPSQERDPSPNTYFILSLSSAFQAVSGSEEGASETNGALQPSSFGCDCFDPRGAQAESTSHAGPSYTTHFCQVS